MSDRADAAPRGGIDPRGPRFAAGITAVLLLVVVFLGLTGLSTAQWPAGSGLIGIVDPDSGEGDIAGVPGAAMLQRFLELGWLRRTPAGRAVMVRAEGRRGLAAMFGLRV